MNTVPFASLLLSLCLFLTGCQQPAAQSFSLEDVPAFSDAPYVTLSDNVPTFPDDDKTSVSFERYSQLDYYSRCGTAYANVGPETMPTEERGSIGQVKPTGWHTVKYDFVDGKYLYNRCHLIGYQLTAENANELNLITGTRYMNVDGMLPFENQVADYIHETSNHVLYRVTPVYDGTDLVARGVQMEAWSVEDQGEGVCFNVYVYNVQPGVEINYATGASWLAGETPVSETPEENTAPAWETVSPGSVTPAESTYVLNTSSKKFHRPTCSGISGMSPSNRQDYTGNREDLIDAGYSPCGQCKP